MAGPTLSNSPRGASWAVAVAAVFSLSIPSVSIGVLFAAIAALYLSFTRLIVRTRALFRTTALLVVFSVTYFSIASVHGLASPTDGLKYGVAFLGSYLLGFWHSQRTHGTGTVRHIGLLLALVAGSTLFAYLCSQAALVTVRGIELSERAVPNVWNRGELLNVPGLGAMASLGMCILPVALFGSPRATGRLMHAALVVAAIVLSAMGAQGNLTFQNRSPFMALLAAVALGATATLASTPGLRARALRIGVATAFAVGALLVARSNLLADRMLLQRFEEMGLQSDRFTAWATMAASLLEEPWGGRTVDVGLAYVHNLWLDVARDAGIVPFALLVLFHALHVPDLVRISRSNESADARLVTIGVAVAYLAAFMAEPVLAFSPAYFTGSLMFFGFVRAYSGCIRFSREDSPRVAAPASTRF